MDAKVQFSEYRNSYDTNGVIASLDAISLRIQTGDNGLAEKTRYCNALAQTEPATYKAYKEKELPAVTFSATFPKGKRKAQHLLRHSGLVTIDIDGLTAEQIPDLLAALAQMPQVVLAFISPSGTGIKAIVRVDPIPLNDLEHKGAYAAAKAFFDNLATEFEFEIDTSGKDCSRLCYLAHDPLAIVNTNAGAIHWDREAWEQAETERQERFEAAAQIPFTGEVDGNALDYIDPNDLTYDQWLSVITACKVAGLSWQQVDAWSQRGGVRYTVGEIETRWDGLNLDVNWGAVVNLAKLNEYTPPTPTRNHKPVKLQKSDVALLTETIEKAREAVRTAFESGKKLIGLRGDTGIGKNYEVTQLFQLKGINGFISTPTTDLAKELEARGNKAGVIMFRWRGLHAEPNGEFPHENPCMYPDAYQAYAESGRNAYKMLCEPCCPYLDECEQYGYRSQEREAQNAQVTVAPHKDVLINPLFRSTAERLLPKHKDDLIVVDEFDVFESFIEINIPQSRLEYLRDTWHDHPLGDLAMDILHACVVQNAPHTGISMALEIMKDTDRHAILQALASYRIGDTILDRKKAEARTADIGQPVEHIQALPKIETETWNLLLQLELFFDKYQWADSAPIQWKDNALTFYLPPLPLYTKAKVLCMSATLNKVFFEKAFEHRQTKRDDVGFIDAADTDWHPEAQAYQLRTNRNPRGTLLELEKDATTGKYHATDTLSSTGHRTLNAILESSKAQQHLEHYLISFKQIVETHGNELTEAGIEATAHFGNLVGLDEHFGRDTDTPIVLHILGAPEIPPHETERRYTLLYGDAPTAPDFTRDDTTGAYHDKNVQAVYEAGVKSELVQAIGRAGLVKKPSIVILWSSHDLPSFSHREQTAHFDETDWATAEGILDVLKATIETREARETAEAEAIEKADVQAVMEITGLQKSQAYNRIQQASNEKRRQEAEQVKALDEAGKSLRAIERELGISRNKIKKLLDKYEAVQNSDTHYVTLSDHRKNAPPPENTDVTGIDSENQAVQLVDANGRVVHAVIVQNRPRPIVRSPFRPPFRAWRKRNIVPEIEKMYRDGHSHSEIAQEMNLLPEFVKIVLEAQAF